MNKITVGEEVAFAEETQVALQALRGVTERLLRDGVSITSLVAASSLAYTSTLGTLLALSETAGAGHLCEKLRTDAAALVEKQLDDQVVHARKILRGEAAA